MSKEYKIIIKAQPTYLPEQSSEDEHRFLWAYEIAIENCGSEIVQLLNRFWHIIDMSGHIENVRGPGVVGLQPLIKPGKQFIYSSYCQLSTPQGTMEGYYEMQNLDEQHFIVQIPRFYLSCPSEKYRSKLH